MLCENRVSEKKRNDSYLPLRRLTSLLKEVPPEDARGFFYRYSANPDISVKTDMNRRLIHENKHVLMFAIGFIRVYGGYP